jgi:tellurite resistance protein TehA-like permease
MVRQDHSLSKMTAVWLLPIVTIIVASSTGGDIAVPLLQHQPTLAILTAGFSFTMVLIGLSLSCVRSHTWIS